MCNENILFKNSFSFRELLWLTLQVGAMQVNYLKKTKETS